MSLYIFNLHTIMDLWNWRCIKIFDAESLKEYMKKMKYTWVQCLDCKYGASYGRTEYFDNGGMSHEDGIECLKKVKINNKNFKCDIFEKREIDRDIKDCIDKLKNTK